MKTIQRPFGDVATEFAAAAAELYGHPECPEQISDLLQEIEAEAFNHANAVCKTPEMQVFRFREILAAGLNVLAKAIDHSEQGAVNA